MKLIDRFRNAEGVLVLRTQGSSGSIFDVCVTAESAKVAGCSLAAAEQEAASIWSGNEVPWERVDDGSLIFRATPGAMTATEFENFDFLDWCVSARKVAPQATTAQLKSIYETPMPANQRASALAGLSRSANDQ